MAKQKQPMDVRQLVLDRLKQLDRSPYWLVNHAGVEGMSTMTIKRFVYGMNDICVTRLGPILDAVGLRIAPVPKFKLKKE